ncbi:polymer-forming cytoskeletal protein [candidate division KSB1 bacterium]|nr:polymer-forming cytoskeletal protein [candidate division KSB1 bacterium]
MFREKDSNGYDRMGDLNTLIGKGTIIEGNMTVQHSLRIDGKLVGNLKSSDSIILGKEGVIHGEIEVKNAVIGGTVKGKISATGKVTLESTAVLVGKLNAVRLVIAEGAVFDGHSQMKGTKLEPALNFTPEKASAKPVKNSVQEADKQP